MQGGNSVQDQIDEYSQSSPVNSSKSICISQGGRLISMEYFQLIHASSYCADSVGVHFLGICGQFCACINQKM